VYGIIVLWWKELWKHWEGCERWS